MMTTLHAAPTADTPVAPRHVLMLATGAGFSVASIYYSQPMLGILLTDLHARIGLVGLIPTLTQIG